MDDPHPWITIDSRNKLTGEIDIREEFSAIATVVSGRPRVMLNSLLNVTFTLTLFRVYLDSEGIQYDPE